MRWDAEYADTVPAWRRRCLFILSEAWQSTVTCRGGEGGRRGAETWLWH